ncbi:MAG: TonB-dependent siderophore receptor [Methylocella sp.]
MARNGTRRKRKGKGNSMGSTFAAMAMSAFAMGAPGSTAQASIPPQQAADAVRTYTIPSGSMANALSAFADANGFHLLYDTRLAQALKTRGLSGRYSPQEGLGLLLSGTGLSYRFVRKGNAVSIVLAQNDTGTQTDANGASELPTVEVTANQQGAPAGGAGGGGTGCGPYGGAPCSGFGGAGLAQDPYNPSYVLPTASTGTKTDTPVMDTPLNVQSVTQQVLQDQQAITLGQALQNVSGVSVTDGSFSDTGQGSSGILVRGFPEQTYYRDGFRVDSTLTSVDNVSTRQLANVASVEVLKGPGAVLYGLVEPGGIVNIVTKEPLDVPYFAVQQQIGSLALYRTTVDATGPVTDDKAVLYRMNMSYENNGAPFNSFIDLTNSQSLFFAPVVKWTIDGATWVKLEAEYNQYRSDSYFPFDPLFNGAFVNIPRSTNYGESSPFLQTTLFTALTWSHHFNNDWSIKQQIAYNNIGNYTNATVPIFIVSPFPPLQVERASLQTQVPQTTYSTNVDITGHFNTFGAEHTLLLGGDIYRTTVSDSTNLYAFTTIDLFNPIHLGIPSAACPCSPSATANTQDTAGLYLQDQIKLPYNFYLLAGTRYQYIHQTNAAGESLDDLQTAGSPLTGQAVTPRFGLLWRPQEWVSFYANFTEGFGPNQGLIFPGVLAPPSSAESSEAGFKLEFFNGKLRVTADYFELVKTNVPTPDPNPAHICNGGPCSLIIGEARSKGPELDIQGEILPGWSVIANYTNDDVRVTEANPGAVPAVGQRLFLVPRNLANFWTTYEFQDETLKGVKIGAGYHYTGSRPVADYANPPGTFPLLPAYGTVDLMAAYSFKLYGANLTAQLNITNLFDTTYYPSAFNDAPVAPGFAGASTLRSYGAPFAAVGSLRAQF